MYLNWAPHVWLSTPNCISPPEEHCFGFGFGWVGGLAWVGGPARAPGGGGTILAGPQAPANCYWSLLFGWVGGLACGSARSPPPPTYPRIPGTDQAVRGGRHGQKLHSGFPPRQVDARGRADARSSTDACLSQQKVQRREANRRRHRLTEPTTKALCQPPPPSR